MIHILDLKFLGQPNTIAAFLIETSEGPILLETGPYSTFPHLEKAIQACGHQLEDIKHVFLTHIHLDHAGAAWAMAEKGAKIYVHPFGAIHMEDPSRLMQSATRIYKENMDSLWGTMKAIPKNQLVIPKDGASIKIGDTEVICWYTPGHAVHHIAWQIGDALIAGDVAGVKIESGIVVPPCPPPDINVEDWQQSIKRIKGLNLSEIYLTHYGKVTNINEHLDNLEAILLDWANWMRPHFEQQRDRIEVIPLFQAYVKQQLISAGIKEGDIPLYESANPSWMSVTGLMRYWKQKLNTA